MSKEKKKSKKGKVAGGVGAVAVLALLAFFGGKGLGLGGGSGLGLNKDANVNADVENKQDEVKEPVEDKQEELPEETVTISIEVMQGQYLIDGAEKSLADIEALLTAENAADTSFVLVDNYAATKAWDEVKALFTKYEINVVEQKK